MITSLTDYKIKVWEAKSGHLKYTLKGHDAKIAIIDPHPIIGDIFLTAGYDGKIIVWNINDGDFIINVIINYSFTEYKCAALISRGGIFPTKLRIVLVQHPLP